VLAVYCHCSEAETSY